MRTTWQGQMENYRRLMHLSDPNHLEAPDRHFIGHRDIITRNLARYRLIEPYVHGVLADIGCGRGYGIAALHGRFTSCVGIDISYEFLRDLHAEQPDVPIALASGEHLPFTDQSFDTLIAFEVIEHLEDDEGFLRQLRKLLRSDGMLAISTPNRVIASGTAEHPLNKFHVREYMPEEFRALLMRVFDDVTLMGQYDYTLQTGGTSLADRIPIQWKYQLPIHIQGLLSIMTRAPLHLEDCQFTSEELDLTHTLIAFCR
ncbi:MAG: methyltransferase domain-containing protein [Roseiflexaceae bacterium]|nr:methyltransferase domain-containing protein [Roseiflexaceae bacterium]